MQFSAEIKQPFQATPGSSTLARPISASGRYITNHLPFQLLPDIVYSMPVREASVRAASTGPRLFAEAEHEGEEQEPIWAGGHKAGAIYSFADLNAFPRFADDRGQPRKIAQQSRADLETTPDGARTLSWLLRRHFDYHLEHFQSLGLAVERKRAYFIGSADEERAIIYDSPKKRGVRRVMVKRREIGKRIFHENEGIWYSVERFAGTWGIRLKPTYVFTEPDGRTPLPPFMISRLATRRFRFDRNKNVDDDMTFWTRFLGRGRPVIGIGGPGVNNLILALDYVSFEVLEEEVTDEYSDQNTA